MGDLGRQIWILNLLSSNVLNVLVLESIRLRSAGIDGLSFIILW